MSRPGPNNPEDTHVFSVLETIIIAALDGGREALAVYADDFGVEIKADSSPVTAADLRSEAAILAVLATSFPHIPVIAEESGIPDPPARAGWSEFFLVDPLDGTKEFVSRNGEFTVNVALMRRTGEEIVPHLGVVLAPVTGELFAGHVGVGAWRCDLGADWTGSTNEELFDTARWEQLPVGDRSALRPSRHYTVVASRSHRDRETDRWIEERRLAHPDLVLITAGSSLKFCRVATGEADAYPRFGPTMAWDTAAGDAVARAVGCSVSGLDYRDPDLRNGGFLVEAAP